MAVRLIDKSWVALGCGLGLAVSGWAVPNDPPSDPYQAIVKRNAFALKPIPIAPIETVKPLVQTNNIKLTGITTMPITDPVTGLNTPGVKKVYFLLPDPDHPNAFLYPCVKEGEQDAGIEVLGADEKQGWAKIKYHGTPMELTFAANGNAAVPLSLPSTAPAVGPLPTPGAIPPGVINANPPMAVPTRGMTPSRPVGGLMRNNVGASFPAAGGALPTQMQIPDQIPGRPMRTDMASAPPVNPVQNQANYVTSMINVELQRQVSQPQVAAGLMPPLPPTDFSEPGAPGGTPPPGMPVPRP